jgi:hypothetical protein
MGVLISAMTNPDYQNNLLIVFAGYTQEMDNMLESDPGLKRRISARVEFKDLEDAALEEYFHKFLQKAGTSISSECHGQPIQSIFTELKRRPGWGNIGDVEKLCALCFAAASTRLRKECENMNAEGQESHLSSWNKQYSSVDLENARISFLHSRPARSNEPNKPRASSAQGTQDALMKNVMSDPYLATEIQNPVMMNAFISLTQGISLIHIKFSVIYSN